MSLTGNIRNKLQDFDTITADETLTRMKKLGGSLHLLEITNINPHDVYVQFFDVKQGDCAAFADYSSGTVVKCTVEADGIGHRLGEAGDTATITIAGTTSYNGDFTVTVIDPWSFYFTDTWVADDATGTWREQITLGTTVPDFSKFCPKGDGTMRGASMMESDRGRQFVDGITFAVTTTARGNTAPTAAIEFHAGFLG